MAMPHRFSSTGTEIQNASLLPSVSVRAEGSCGVLPQNTHNFVEHVISSIRAHNGGILLMHEIHHNTLHQLEEIIVQLKSEGFDFTNIEDPTFTSSLR